LEKNKLISRRCPLVTEREELTGNDGVVESIFKTPAISDVGQAERFAETILQEDVNMRWLVTFKTNIKGLALQIFDVIDVTHGSQPSWSAKLFRIEEITHDAEDRMQIKASEYFAAYI